MEIELKRGSDAEVRTQTVLRRLLRRYDLADWIFTRRVVLDETAKPHSHPVMTLDTEFERNESLLLAAFVHEQLHWFEEEHAESRDRAIEETKLHYAEVPGKPPEGAVDEYSTRLHLLVCYLEYQALKRLLGIPEAKATILAVSRNHYHWIYKTVLADEEIIGKIVRQYDLLPGPLRISQKPTVN